MSAVSGTQSGKSNLHLEEPEFWFGNNGTLWFAHFCKNRDRQYSLPEVIYEVTSEKGEPITVAQPVACGDCGLRGRITEGVWVDIKSRIVEDD